MTLSTATKNPQTIKYPFGMIMPGRAYESGSEYRYGFNGMEADDELKGNGNSYDFGARMYDSRIGRWLSVDPLHSKYPYLTPYHFTNNSPIIYQDFDGRDFRYSVKMRTNEDGTVTKVITARATYAVIDLTSYHNAESGPINMNSVDDLADKKFDFKWNAPGYLKDNENKEIQFDNVELNFEIDFRHIESLNGAMSGENVLLVVDAMVQSKTENVAGRATIGGKILAVEGKYINKGFWNTLVLHEIGHNIGLSHKDGGLMDPAPKPANKDNPNSSPVPGLKTSDREELNTRFGFNNQGESGMRWESRQPKMANIMEWIQENVRSYNSEKFENAKNAH